MIYNGWRKKLSEHFCVLRIIRTFFWYHNNEGLINTKLSNFDPFYKKEGSFKTSNSLKGNLLMQMSAILL